MQISELLRRGDFARSKIFLSNSKEKNSDKNDQNDKKLKCRRIQQCSSNLGINLSSMMDSQSSISLQNEIPNLFNKICSRNQKYKLYQQQNKPLFLDNSEEQESSLRNTKDSQTKMSTTTYHSKKPSTNHTEFFHDRNLSSSNATTSHFFQGLVGKSQNQKYQVLVQQSEQNKQSISSIQLSTTRKEQLSFDFNKSINMHQTYDKLNSTVQNFRSNREQQYRNNQEKRNYQERNESSSSPIGAKNITSCGFKTSPDRHKRESSTLSKLLVEIKESNKNVRIEALSTNNESIEKTPLKQISIQRKEFNISDQKSITKRLDASSIKMNNESPFSMPESNEKPKTQEKRSEEKQDCVKINPKLKGLIGALKMKNKINQIIIKKKNGDLEEVQKGEKSLLNHKQVLEQLKMEEGEIFDIYGTFNDKIKQIQVQIKETLNQYSLSQDIMQQLQIEKKKYRVIDVVENTICSICQALEYLQQVPNHIGEKEELDKILAQQAISLMKSPQANLIIQIETVFIYAKFCQEISNYGKALRLFKQCKNMAITNLTQNYRMISYMSIGKCFQNLKLYPTAILYFGKYLEYSWFLDDKEAELNAYDMLGITHYLTGDLECAKFYHEKMSQNDNEPSDSNVRILTIKKIFDKLKKINSEEYAQKLAHIYKKFFAKIHSIDYEDDYECSSSEDEFEISIPKTSSQNKNKENGQFLKEKYQDHQRKADAEKKRFIAIFNAEDRFTQQSIKKQANQNIRMQELHRLSLKLPPAIKYNSAQSFKPILSTQKTPFCVNQFTINRNLDNYLTSDSKTFKSSTYDFFKLVEDSNDKKLKTKIIFLLNKFQSNLIFALSQIHCMREREKYSQNSRRRIGFSGLSEYTSSNQLAQMNLNVTIQAQNNINEENRRIQLQDDTQKPNSNQSKFMAIDRYQLPHEIGVVIQK